MSMGVCVCVLERTKPISSIATRYSTSLFYSIQVSLNKQNKNKRVLNSSHFLGTRI